MHQPPSSTVRFLFADIEGSMKLAREHAAIWEALRARYHAILHDAVAAHDGYVFQIIGDAFWTAFHTAHDALHAALDAQLDIRRWNVEVGNAASNLQSPSSILQVRTDGQGCSQMIEPTRRLPLRYIRH
ncbi:MAG: hypothetical protein LC737_03600 [Chloroflexi bacterium]|nr:hypothetical protein [Chloroflexota bacterium]